VRRTRERQWRSSYLTFGKDAFLKQSPG